MKAKKNIIGAIQTKWGYTQEDIARACQVSQVAVNRWSLGKARPHKVFQRMLEKILEEGIKNETL